MTLEHVIIAVVACFLSTFLVSCSCVSSLERTINKYHRQELEAIDELKKSLENKDPYVYLQPDFIRSRQPWQYEDFDPYRSTLTPCGTEDDILYPSHNKNKEGING